MNYSLSGTNPPLHPLPKAPTVGQEGTSINAILASKVPSLEGQWGGLPDLPISTRFRRIVYAVKTL